MYSDLDLTVLVKYTETLKVLYVEDNKDSREALGSLLENYFSEITYAYDGEDALKKFNDDIFDLVITDIRMPKMNGIELMQEIRKIDEDMPLIVSTAHNEAELLHQCIELGVNGYLIKPINHKQLTRAIKCVCGRLYYFEETKKYERTLETLVQERTKELEKIQTELMQMTHKDPLTNLYNRRYFNEIANTLMHISHREKSALSALMLDIDRFKTINDTYGHLIGDVILKELSSILMKHTRESDVVIRYGGEEFLILLPSTPLEGARSIAEKIRDCVEKKEVLVNSNNDTKVKFTVSIGVVQCKCAQRKDKNRLVDRADKAMYKAKKAGRNRVEVYDE